MTHTTNFNLSQWAKTDRIRMADFNADNAKLDAALAARNCALSTTTYVGTGSGPRSFTFPHKPRIVFVMNGDLVFMAGLQGVPQLMSAFLGSVQWHDAAWQGNTFTWQLGDAGADVACNESGKTYTMTALLDVDD